MTDDNANRAEIRRLRHLLREIAEVARHASLTGSLSDGARSAARRHNTVLKRLEQFGVLSPDLFQPLSEESSFDEIGVESSLLAGYLKEDAEERPDKAQRSSPNVIIGSLNGLQGLEELKDLGQVIRDHLPEWMRGQAAAKAERPEDEPEPPRPTPPQPEPARPAGPEPMAEPMPDFTNRD